MLYIFVALYAEAEPIIRRLGLKQEKMEFGFYIYTTDQYKIKLVITGIGITAAGINNMFAYDCTGKNRNNNILINFGSCVGNGRIGETYLCNKIIDHISGRTFYPDILYSHNYPERYIITEAIQESHRRSCCRAQSSFADKNKSAPFRFAGDFDKNNFINSNNLNISYKDGLYDMEAAIIYQAGLHFFEPQNMSFIKVISNTTQGKKIHAKELTEIIEIEIDYFLEYLMKCIKRNAQKEIQAKKEDKIYEQGFEQICQDLHCSEAMKRTMKQYIKYWSLTGMDYQTIFRQMREQKELPCKDRREGKKKIEEFRRNLL